MAFLLLIFSTISTLAIWILGIRPYVVSNKQGYKTGANLAVAMWVDWQSCGEIAKATDDFKGKILYRIFGFLQMMSAIGIILLCV